MRILHDWNPTNDAETLKPPREENEKTYQSLSCSLLTAYFLEKAQTIQYYVNH